MSTDHEALLARLAVLREQTQRLRHQFPARFNALLQAIAQADPIGICDDMPDSQERYAAVIGTLLPRLAKNQSPANIQAIVFEELTWWFNTPGGSVVERPEKYTHLAEKLWNVSQICN